MELDPLVSVLLTAYDADRYLPATLASILGQTYGHFELLVMDDGSRDGSWSILKEIAARDGRVQLFRQEHNLGVPSSMNVLFRRASGPYVTRHDADDVSYPERFARQVAFLEGHPTIGVVGTRVRLIDGDDRPLDLPLFTAKFSNEEIQAELLRDNCLCQGSVMFRRELLARVGLYDESNIGSEDYDLWLRMAEVTEFAILDEVLYQYRVHPGSLSHRRRHEQAFHAARALEQALQRRYGASPPLRRREALAQYYLQAAVAASRTQDSAATREYVGHALRVYPPVFENQDGLTGLLMPVITSAGTGEALRTIQFLFAECRPPTKALRDLKSRWLAEIHMQAVFHNHGQMAREELQNHLWLGIKNRPAWLFNRGVLALLLRSRLSQQ